MYQFIWCMKLMFEFAETERKHFLTQINFVHELPQYEQQLHIYLDKTSKPTTMILRTYLLIRQEQQQLQQVN
jgi:cell division protein ZapA (FtsZ GTPase activity inhibitor)